METFELVSDFAGKSNYRKGSLMKKKEEVYYHIAEIKKHKDALIRMSAYKEKYVLPTWIPFLITITGFMNCDKCKSAKHSLIAYKSRLSCSRCMHRKYGKMTIIKDWEVVKQ